MSMKYRGHKTEDYRNLRHSVQSKPTYRLKQKARTISSRNSKNIKKTPNLLNSIKKNKLLHRIRLIIGFVVSIVSITFSALFGNKKTHHTKESKETKSTKTLSPIQIIFNFILDGIKSVQSNSVFQNIQSKIHRATIIQSCFVLVFGIIVWKMADLQVASTQEERALSSPSLFSDQIILSSRGQIYFKDISQSKTDIPLTTTSSLAHVFFDASVLKEQIEKKILSLETASEYVSAALTINYDTIYKLFLAETSRPQPSKYVLITKFVNSEQKKAIEFLRFPTIVRSGDDYIPPFNAWLNFESVETRYYPEHSLLAQTVGYVPRVYSTKADALNAGCSEMVAKNEERGTVNTFIPGDWDKGQYSVGYYGIEQKFCSELAGLNGRKPLNRELNTSKENESRVRNGSDIYLTIDRNIQKEAEAQLRIASEQEKPTDATIIVMEVKTGKILAMASSPTFDPNNYSRSDPAGFRNVATSGDYEAGSVIKPLTVAAALNEWEAGSTDSKGNRIGVPPDWTFLDYDKKGKPYQENNGRIFYIRNSQGLSWADRGTQTLSTVLRDSINTGIAEIQPKIGNTKTREYFEERFMFGKKTLIGLPGDTSGNVNPLTANINSPFTYATHGFGQGFTVSPIQLARAYTPLANNGKRVEPVLVEKIVNSDGTIETTSTSGSRIQQPIPQQVLSETTARLVTGYLVNTVDQGYLGAKPSKGQVPGYTIAGKTGTSEVGRTPKVKCGIEFSVYDCNTSQGIYDHTYVGYGPVSDPKILIIVKFSEPNKGVVANFAENTTGPYFSRMMKYTLEYLGVPKEAGR